MWPPVEHQAQHATGEHDEQPRQGCEHRLAPVAMHFLCQDEEIILHLVS
jgi:hypothetical protein